MPNSFRDQIEDPILTQLYDYWRPLVSGKSLPSRGDIDPVQMPRRTLPYVVLAEVHNEGARVRYRLVGTAMVREWGEDFTGRFVDEIMTGTYLEFMQGLFLDVAHHRCAVLSESTFRWDVGKVVGTRRLFMPLASDGKTVDMVLIGQTFNRDLGSPCSPRKVIETLPGHAELFRRRDMPMVGSAVGD